LSLNPSIISRWWALPLILVVSTALAAVLVFVFAAVIVYPTLPTLDKLTDYRPKVPLRVYSAEGRLIGSWGSPGAGPGQFNLPHGLQVDEKGNVWVADRTNIRYQVLDNNLKPIRELTNLGVGWTLCISPGPHQYVFHSNSNPNGNLLLNGEATGEIYKTELDGTVLGKFGKPGKVAPGFQVVHMMDCRNPNEIILGEIESWRVQKLILKPQDMKKASSAP
jgi:hypothetical protein